MGYLHPQKYVILMQLRKEDEYWANDSGGNLTRIKKTSSQGTSHKIQCH
jgi:hypothetical protein